MLKTKYDAVIAGAGPAGLLAANVLADTGASVLLLEADRRHIGGNGVHHAAHLLKIRDTVLARAALQSYRYRHAVHGSRAPSRPPAAAAEMRQWSLEKFDAFEEAIPALLRQLKQWDIALRPTASSESADSHPPSGISTCSIAPANVRHLPEKYRRKLRQLSNYALFNRVHIPQSSVDAASTGSAYGMWSVTAELLRYFFDYPWRLRSTQDRRACDGAALVSQLIVRLLDRENVTFVQYAQLSNIHFSHRQVMAVDFMRAQESINVETGRLILATGDHLQDADYAQTVFGNAFAAMQSQWNTQHAGAALADGVELAELAGAQCVRMNEIYGRLVHAPARSGDAGTGAAATAVTAIDQALAQPDCLLIEATGRRVQVQHRRDCLTAYERAFNTLHARYECHPPAQPQPSAESCSDHLSGAADTSDAGGAADMPLPSEPMQLDLLANGENRAGNHTDGETHPDNAQGSPAMEQEHATAKDATTDEDRTADAAPSASSAPADTPPLFAVFDSRFREKKPFGSLLPASLLPDDMLPATHWQSLLYRADTPAELAACTGIDPTDLERALAAHNRLAKEQQAAAAGTDEDTDADAANLTGASDTEPAAARCTFIGAAPFYAAPVFPGHAGCRGGVKTNGDGQVLTGKGYKINGLYAVGGCAASVLGEGVENTEALPDAAKDPGQPVIDSDALEFTETLVTAYRAALHAADLPMP